MAFGTGTGLHPADAGAVKGKQKEVACECWFTSTGKITPLMLKIEDEDGEIQVIKEITVHSQEMKRYAGNPSLEFDCSLWLGERKMRAKLIYYLAQSRWVLNIFPWAVRHMAHCFDFWKTIRLSAG